MPGMGLLRYARALIGMDLEKECALLQISRSPPVRSGRRFFRATRFSGTRDTGSTSRPKLTEAKAVGLRPDPAKRFRVVWRSAHSRGVRHSGSLAQHLPRWCAVRRGTVVEEWAVMEERRPVRSGRASSCRKPEDSSFWRPVFAAAQPTTTLITWLHWVELRIETQALSACGPCQTALR